MPFAEWVANPDNPLTTRTIVNRLWLWHFNQPIAGNPNNFGSTGKRPTHPELLDWLAAEFIDKGWSVKALHRLLMNSETSAQKQPASGTIDPRGEGSGAILLRSVLSTSSHQQGTSRCNARRDKRTESRHRRNCKTVRKSTPKPLCNHARSWERSPPAWVPNPLPSQRHRRSLYSLKLRGLTDPFLEVFNSPAPDFSCERRESSAITPQVFSLLNGKTIHDRALALAHRAIKDQTAIRRPSRRALNEHSRDRLVRRR